MPPLSHVQRVGPARRVAGTEGDGVVHQVDAMKGGLTGNRPPVRLKTC